MDTLWDMIYLRVAGQSCNQIEGAKEHIIKCGEFGGMVVPYTDLSGWSRWSTSYGILESESGRNSESQP